MHVLYCVLKESQDPGMVQFKSPFEMRLFMMAPNSEESIQISHPAAAANCSDVPIFRLIEMVFSQAAAQLSPVSFFDSSIGSLEPNFKKEL